MLNAFLANSRYAANMVNHEFELLIALASLGVGVIFLWVARHQPD